jgi:uncharacterized membrane protein
MTLHDNIILGLIIIGIINTMYISWHVIKPSDVACLFFPLEWCHKVQYSKYSKTFGIPNGYLGFTMLIFILILMILYIQAAIPFWPIALICTFGFVFSVYFLYIQAGVLKAFCPWCIVSFLVFTGLFIESLIKMGYV